MCNNIIVLYIFIILKIIVYFIMPFILLFLRKKRYFNILLYVELGIVLFFTICNITDKNACVNNSNFKMVKYVEQQNEKRNYDELHTNSGDSDVGYTNSYKTYTGKNLYYYNLNKGNLKDSYYDCKDKKIYFNEVGSGISAFATAISTLYDKSVDPLEIFKYYEEDNKNLCNNEIAIDDIYNSVMKRYGAISIREIVSSDIESTIKNGGLVIAELSAKEGSKLTCDSSYIVIYSIDFDGKYMISDASLKDKSYVCPYSSRAYGSVIDSELMNNSWSLEEINNEAIHYYMVKKG